MHRINGARKPGLRHDGKALGLRLGQDGVGRHDDERSVFARAALGARLECGWRESARASRVRRTRRRARTAPPRTTGRDRSVTLPAALTAASAPTMWPSGVRAEAEPMPPLQLTVVAPVPAPTLPSAKSIAGRRRRRVAELAIGRVAAPVLVAAARADRTGSPPARSARAPMRTAKPRPCSFSHACTPDAASRPNAEPPDERDGVDAFDRLRRIEQRGLARARPAAAHVDRGDRGLVEHDGGRAGAEPQILGVADLHARHVGDEVAHVLPSSGCGSATESLQISTIARRHRRWVRFGRPERRINDHILAGATRGACTAETGRA